MSGNGGLSRKKFIATPQIEESKHTLNSVNKINAIATEENSQQETKKYNLVQKIASYTAEIIVLSAVAAAAIYYFILK